MRTPISGTTALWFGYLTLAIFLLVFFGLAANISIQSAVVSSGRLVLGQSTHWVQHPSGGKVKELAVRAGQKVEKGTIVLILDDQHLVSQRETSTRQLLEYHARRARLIAQRDGKGHLRFEHVKTPTQSLEIPETLKAIQRDILIRLGKNKSDETRSYVNAKKA